jgi:mRNA-degrading endonuclease YafQ of YafQ-DinJ toxin-antitoxin module
MPYRLIFTERYMRIALRFLKRHPDMARAYEKTLALLQVNPHHPSLRLHELGGRLKGVHSVSINMSYRITLQLLIAEHEIVPLNVGDHDAVY